MILVAAQVLDGVSGTILGVLTALIVADFTKGTGWFNLAQGFVGTMSGVGASLSTTLSSLVTESLGRRISGHLGSASPLCSFADARDQFVERERTAMSVLLQPANRDW